jgi:trehalose 6-phosphate phosphatase
VARPELARPAPGAREALAALVPRVAVVAVVSGRPTEDVRSLLGVEGVRYVGMYGMEAEALPADLKARAEEAAAAVPGAWVEDKGGTVAVHYRQAPQPPEARRALLRALAPLAEGSGLALVEGKMVVELVPEGRPMKGGAVERMARELRIDAALYAGDDVADLEAFAALDRLASGGLDVLRVAVEGPETPEELRRAADVVVPGPAGLVALLRGVAGG